MDRKSILEDLQNDLSLGSIPVKTIVIQETIWSGIVECRCFSADGGVFAAMYQDDKKLTAFAVVPNQEKK